MERLNPESIGDVLRETFRQLCMDKRLDELKAADMWQKVVGEDLAARCKRPTVNKGVMTVGVADAALRHELMMSRTSLRRAINNIIGKEIITEIRFSS